MAYLSYWIAFPRTDNLDNWSLTYAFRARTRRAVREEMQRYYEKYGEWGYHEPPQKVGITYRDAFDLLTHIMSAGGFEEHCIREEMQQREEELRERVKIDGQPQDILVSTEHYRVL